MARRILLADDSVTAQNMGRRILTDAGYDVITVNNGSAALKKITENRPDLIVLDVYMPGYGGLEVCQRVKENQETTRIPVLLTVGKLEPFKPEEARRVGADAFIVKPFEATELLTALTKLEDKIVAAPQPQKSGRFAKALAAVEQSDKGASFGDKETGWKNRLTIPSPNFKPKPGEAEPAEVPASMARELDRGEGFKPTEPREFERPIPAGLPADITPEEIAAIAAAAASIGGQPQQTAAAPETPPVEGVASQEAAPSEIAAAPASAPETPAITSPSAPEPEREIRAEAPVEMPAEAPPIAAEAVSETVASEPAKPEEQPAATELPALAAQADSETRITAETESPAAERPAGNGNDAEVMAAIAWLAPANGHAIENIQPTQTSTGTGQEFSASAYLSGITAAVQATGPRWIAEAVTVASDEAMLVLEHEMEQARVASVAVEAAPAHLPSAAAIVSEASSSEVSSPEISSPEILSPEVSSPEVPSQAPVVEPAEIAQPVVMAVASVETPAAPVETQSVPAPVALESASVESPAVEIAQPAMVTSESAYAAAASAGSTAERAQPAEELSSAATAPGLSQNNSPAYPESTQREAELAAAWQNWRHIRESFVSSQPSAEPANEHIAETSSEPSPQLDAPADQSTAAEVSAQPEEAVTAPAPEDAEATPEAAAEASDAEPGASETPGESTAIASIVDTMLAELRPKLVEEIAKKMSSEKKEKDKKKKK